MDKSINIRLSKKSPIKKDKIMKNESVQQKRYQNIQIVGNGTFGCVYLAKDLQKNGQKVAVKHVHQNKKYKNREIEIMKSISHSNIVQLYDHFYEDIDDLTFLNLIMEYMPYTLSSLIKDNMYSKAFISNDLVIKYSYGLLKALYYLQEKGIAHRDIKPSNILINDEGDAKLCDFGSAKILVSGQKNIAYICSRYYRSPELILGATDYTTLIDTWSLGCCIVEMLMNRPLFDGDMQAMKVEKKVIQKVQPIGIASRILKINPNASQQIIDLIQKMLVYNPQKRIRPQEALKLPLFKHLSEEQNYDGQK